MSAAVKTVLRLSGESNVGNGIALVKDALFPQFSSKVYRTCKTSISLGLDRGVIFTIWSLLCVFNQHFPDTATISENGLHSSARCRGCRHFIYRKPGEAWRVGV